MFSRLLFQNIAITAAIIFLSIPSCKNASRSADIVTNVDKPYAGGGSLTLVFYNVENLFDTIDDPLTDDNEYLPGTAKDWNSDKYSTKLDRLAEVLSRNTDGYPVFIGFSEVENESVLTDLTSHPDLIGGGYGILLKDSPDERGIDVGLAYRKSIFTPITVRHLSVTLPEGDRPTRDILYTHGQIKDGPDVHIFVNHWPSRGGGAEETTHKRMAASQTLASAIEAITGTDADAHIVVMGDFNDYPKDASLQELKNVGLHNLMEGLSETERGSYNYRGSWDFLDQILVSQSLKDGVGLEIKEGSTAAFHFPEMLYTDPKYHDEKPNRTYGGDKYFGGYSDHLPVKTVLEY